MGTFSRRAVLFGGSNEYATAGNVNDFANNVDFSVGGWFRPTVDGTDIALISKRSVAGNQEGYELRRRSSGTFVFLLTGTDGTSVFVETTSTLFDDGQYRHIVATWAGTSGNAAANVTLYVDGTAVALTTVTDTLAATCSNTASFQISGVNGTTRVMTGLADDCFVYNKVLTAGEVTTLYGAGDPPDLTVAGPTGNLQGYWLMGDGDTFPTLIDSGTGGNNLTMTNMESTDIGWSPAAGVAGCFINLPDDGKVYCSGVNRSIGHDGCLKNLVNGTLVPAVSYVNFGHDQQCADGVPPTVWRTSAPDPTGAFAPAFPCGGPWEHIWVGQVIG